MRPLVRQLQRFYSIYSSRPLYRMVKRKAAQVEEHVSLDAPRRSQRRRIAPELAVQAQAEIPSTLSTKSVSSQVVVEPTPIELVEEDPPSSDLSDVPLQSPKKKRAPRKPRAKKAPELYELGQPVPKKKRVMKPKPPVVYVIPDVERKHTTFRGKILSKCLMGIHIHGNLGRLGYVSRACFPSVHGFERFS